MSAHTAERLEFSRQRPIALRLTTRQSSCALVRHPLTAKNSLTLTMRVWGGGARVDTAERFVFDLLRMRTFLCAPRVCTARHADRW